MALCANFCATNMDPRFMALEDFSKLFQVPHPLAILIASEALKGLDVDLFQEQNDFSLFSGFLRVVGYLLLVSCLTLVLSQLSETGKLSSIALWLLLGEKTCQQIPMSCGDQRTYQLSKTALNLVLVRGSLEEKKVPSPQKRLGREGCSCNCQWRTGRRTKGRKCAHATVAKLPIKGLSLVIGIISDTVFRNIVRERRIVTPENQTFIFTIILMKKVSTECFCCWLPLA